MNTQEVSRQIAELVNSGTQNVTKLTAEKVEAHFADWAWIANDVAVLACARLHKLSWWLAEVSYLATHPEHRRKGLALQLTAQLVELARSRGFLALTCLTRLDNYASQGTVAKSGFMPMTQAYNPGTGKDLIVWILTLTVRP